MADYNHLSSTGANLSIKESNVSAALNYTGNHNTTSASNNTA